MPRPTRFLFEVAPLGGRKFDKFVGTLISLLRNRHCYCPAADYSVALFWTALSFHLAGLQSPDFPISRLPDL